LFAQIIFGAIICICAKAVLAFAEAERTEGNFK
jgi:hypothetical protein